MKTIYVVPNFGNRSDLISPSVRSFSLQEIVNNQSDYFTSNTILKLVPAGVYHIHSKIILRITNVANLVLKSSDNTKVEFRCTQNATFKVSLVNCSNSAIKDITFSYCDFTFHVLCCSNMSLFNTMFIRNKGAILIQNSELEFKDQLAFHNNSAKDYESFLYINKSSKITISAELYFVGNTAECGGALLVYNSTVNLNKVYANFIRNSAASEGGAIALKNQSILNGSVEKVVFRQNTAKRNGGAVYVDKSGIYLSGELEFLQNTARSGGAVALKESEKSELTPNNANLKMIVFKENVAKHYGGAVYIEYSNLHLSSNIYFSENSARYGGAMGFIRGFLTMKNDTNVTVSLNNAEAYGGGVYVNDDAYYSWEETECFVSCDETTCFNSIINFHDNKALFAGSALFGGWIDVCLRSLPNVGIPNFQYDNVNRSDDLSVISSYPTRVCLCINLTVHEITEYHAELYPGQTLHIEAVAIGQRLGVIPSIVRTNAMNMTKSIDRLQMLQDTWRECATIEYTVRSPNKRETLALTIDTPQLPRENSILLNTSIFQQFHIHILLKPCSIGFVFDSINNECTCHQLLKQN
jgi:predicted outer membrane repeat protein